MEQTQELTIVQAGARHGGELNGAAFQAGDRSNKRTNGPPYEYAPPLPLDFLANCRSVGIWNKQRISTATEAHPVADRQRIVQFV